MKFRHDINALRALAVFAVLLFHLDFDFLSGGYIGVDIFFVISGYLISKSILYQLNNKKFNLLQFYSKRIKRLLPALIFVSITTLILGFFVFTPIDYKNLSKSVFISNFFGNNILFWLETGYFDALKCSKPLLHYWSLAVEFQFYLFYPVLILFIKSKKLPFELSILPICLLSFILAITGNHYFPSASFYLLPYRLFEFGLGTLAFTTKLKLRNELKNFITLFGFVIILICCFVYKSPTFFSYYNLYPCLATFFIININASGKFLNIIYKNSFVQFIGKTSYSIYLIHWPLIVFFKYQTHNELNLPNKLLLLSLSILLGVVICKYIENILRNSKNNLRNIRTSIIATSILSLMVFFSDGFSYRYPLLKNLITAKEIEQEKERYWTEIYQKLKSLNKYNKEIIVMGNSHAIDLSYAFIENDIKTKISFLKTDHRCYNCNEPVDSKHKTLCNKLYKENLNHVSWKTASKIYIHDNWPLSDTLNLRVFLSEIRKKTEAPIYVFGPKLTFTKPAINVIYDSKSTLVEEINTFAVQKSEIAQRKKINDDLIHFFENYNTNDHIKYIDILKLQCGSKYSSCEIISRSTSKLLYFDRDHFTREGSVELGIKMKKAYPNLFF